MTYDYSQLLGKIKAERKTQEDVAKAICKNPATLNLKLNGKGFFTQNEIKSICDYLHISSEEIPIFFFADTLQKQSDRQII